MLPSQLIGWVCAVAALAAFLYTIPLLLRGRRDPAVLALCVHFLCSSLSFLEQLGALPPTGILLRDQQHLTPLLTEVAVVGLTGSQTVFLMYWSHPPEVARRRARRRVLVFAGLALALVVLNFALGLSGRRAVAERLTLTDMHDPGYAAYLYFFFAVCALGQFETFRLSLRYMRIAQRPWLRWGMRAAMLGALLSVLHCGIRCWEITGTLSGRGMNVLHSPDWLTGDIGAALKVFGWTVPAWGPSLSLAARWIGKYRSYRRLRPLWVALSRAVPDIVLDPPVLHRIGDVLPLRDLDYRLYRRVIEIRDGQHALRPYLPKDHRIEAGPAGAEAEARALRIALREKRAASAPDPSAAVEPEPSGGGRESAGLSDDIVWLGRVADAFVRAR
ncbi:MAB_1171c family putative transporter [Streptomyces sp. NPDC059002]|uniref:MAB_1171c family putative transporter n=1 Tax=Streptomyces sp. NPDC059002 TaxID=3346690 RepID=UPI0036A4C9F0